MVTQPGYFICPECGSKEPGVIQQVEPDPSDPSPWRDILERIVCAQCGFIIPAHLGERSDGMSVDAARREWRDVYRSTADRERNSPGLSLDDTTNGPFSPLCRIETKIVGIPYYKGAEHLDSPEVFFRRTPENEHDSNAVAVFTQAGQQIGHIPRNEAAVLAPLIDDGMLALKGRAGTQKNEHEIPLELEVFGNEKAAVIQARDVGNDWRAIFHNLFVSVWERKGDYSEDTLREFRHQFRHLAENQNLYPKTRFLDRLFISHLDDLKYQREAVYRDRILAAVKAMTFGTPTGWPELTVIPLDAPAPPAGTLADSVPPLPDPPANGDQIPLNMVCRLPRVCPYPSGAHGLAILAHGQWHSLDWFEAPECAQVYWYHAILSGLTTARAGKPEGQAPPVRSSESSKETILELLAAFGCCLRHEPGGQDDPDRNIPDPYGKMTLAMSDGDRYGCAVYEGPTLKRLIISADELNSVRFALSTVDTLE